MTERKGGRVQEFTPEHIRDIAEAVYRDRLGDDDASRMIANNKGDEGVIRRNAQIYDGMVRSCLRVLKERGELA